jgi:hypothetical protein
MKSVLLSCSIAILLSSCDTQEAYYSAAQSRDATTAFYSDQIMLNLIKAYNRELFVHSDISLVQPAVDTKFSGQFGGGQTVTNTGQNVTTIGGMLAKLPAQIATTAASMASRPLTFNIDPERDNNLSLSLQPEYGPDSVVYGLYFQYLSFTDPSGKDQQWNTDNPKAVDFYMHFRRPKTGGPLMCVSHPPTSGYVPGTLVRYDKNWYYVDTAWAQRYWELCMLIMQRPQPAPVTPNTHTATGARPSSATLKKEQKFFFNAIPPPSH